MLREGHKASVTRNSSSWHRWVPGSGDARTRLAFVLLVELLVVSVELLVTVAALERASLGSLVLEGRGGDGGREPVSGQAARRSIIEKGGQVECVSRCRRRVRPHSSRIQTYLFLFLSALRHHGELFHCWGRGGEG